MSKLKILQAGLVFFGLGCVLAGCGDRSESLENQIGLMQCERVDYIYYRPGY